MVIVGKLKQGLTILSDSKYLSPKVLGLIRHGATVAGALLVFLGYVKSADEVTGLVDTIIAIESSIEGLLGELFIALGTAGSWFAKEKQK